MPATVVIRQDDATVVIKQDGQTLKISSVGTFGVNAPVSSTDNAIARWDGTTGQQLQNSVATVSDTGNPIFPGDTLRVSTARTIAASSDPGTEGDECSDASYRYTYRTGAWRRVAHSTW